MEIPIKDHKDARHISEKIIGKLLMGSLAYFNLVVDEGDAIISNLYFTPVTRIRGKGESLIVVDDYLKAIYLLMSHPKVSEITYHDEENCICALFECPFSMHDEEEENHCR